MRFNDAVFGFVLIAFAVAAGLATRSFPQIPGQEYGAALFPVRIPSCSVRPTTRSPYRMKRTHGKVSPMALSPLPSGLATGKVFSPSMT